MWEEVAMITVSCVLFVQMGLSDAVQTTLRFRSKVLSCCKCLSFWVVLTYLGVTNHKIVEIVTASFLASYAALWLALLYDIAADFYNRIYEKITKDTDSDSQAETDEVS